MPLSSLGSAFSPFLAKDWRMIPTEAYFRLEHDRFPALLLVLSPCQQRWTIMADRAGKGTPVIGRIPNRSGRPMDDLTWAAGPRAQMILERWQARWTCWLVEQNAVGFGWVLRPSLRCFANERDHTLSLVPVSAAALRAYLLAVDGRFFWKDPLSDLTLGFLAVGKAQSFACPLSAHERLRAKRVGLPKMFWPR